MATKLHTWECEHHHHNALCKTCYPTGENVTAPQHVLELTHRESRSRTVERLPDDLIGKAQVGIEMGLKTTQQVDRVMAMVAADPDRAFSAFPLWVEKRNGWPVWRRGDIREWMEANPEWESLVKVIEIDVNAG